LLPQFFRDQLDEPIVAHRMIPRGSAPNDQAECQWAWVLSLRREQRHSVPRVAMITVR
jgi:hypothetical protein